MTTLGEGGAIYVKNNKLAKKYGLNIMGIAHTVIIENFIGNLQWKSDWI